jgi:hypothetical protein
LRAGVYLLWIDETQSTIAFVSEPTTYSKTKVQKWFDEAITKQMPANGQEGL